MVTVFDVAGFPVLQMALEVKTQVTASLFDGMYVYAALVAPLTTAALTFH